MLLIRLKYLIHNGLDKISKIFYPSLPRKFVLGMGIFLLLWMGLTTAAQAAVTLVYFSAISGNRLVILRWETATETNNAGFFIQRSTQSDSGYVRINDDIIPAQGTEYTGSTYEYLDMNLTNGTLYWYRLESVDTSSNSQFSDPVSVVVGGTPVPTSTPTSPSLATNTPLNTSTLTPTSIFTTSTPTSAYIPTATSSLLAYPPPNAQATPSAFFQETSSAPGATSESIAGGPTSTLIPFPTITIVFPEQAAILSNLSPGEQNKDIQGSQIDRVLRLWPLLVLLICWIGLGVWFYRSQKPFD